MQVRNQYPNGPDYSGIHAGIGWFFVFAFSFNVAAWMNDLKMGIIFLTGSGLLLAFFLVPLWYYWAIQAVKDYERFIYARTHRPKISPPPPPKTRYEEDIEFAHALKRLAGHEPSSIRKIYPLPPGAEPESWDRYLSRMTAPPSPDIDLIER